MPRWFSLRITLVLLGTHVDLCTPDFSITNPQCRPGWLPKWQFDDWKDRIPCECRYMFRLDWFFHLTLAWGGPS